MLSQHLGTLYDCSPGPPRSSPLVFLRLASSLAVSPGSPGVPGCLAGTWGLSTIAPRACRDRFPVLPRSSPLVFLLLASSLAVSPGFPGVTGCLASTWGLSTIASRACRDLRRWFFYDLLPRSRSLWLSWDPHVLSQLLGTLCGCSPGPPRSSPLGFFTTCFLAGCLSWLSWGPWVLSKHLGTVTIAPLHAAIFAAGFLRLASLLAVSPSSPGVPGCLAST